MACPRAGCSLIFTDWPSCSGAFSAHARHVPGWEYQVHSGSLAHPSASCRQVAFEWHILNAGSRARGRHRAMMRSVDLDTAGGPWYGEQCPSTNGTEYSTRTRPNVLAQLGVREHTDEDCRVRELLHLAAGAPVVAEGRRCMCSARMPGPGTASRRAIDAASPQGIRATCRCGPGPASELNSRA